MPCNSDYLAATGYETNLSRVACLLDEIDGKTWTKRDWDGYHNRVYSRHLSRLDGDAMVATLCHKLQSTDVTKYSLEMQIWWRDHQKADQERMEKEDRFANAKRLIFSIEEGRLHSQYAVFNLRDIARYVRHLEQNQK